MATVPAHHALGVHLIGGGELGPGLTSDGDCNYYLVRGRKRAVLIDCGAGERPVAVPAGVDAVLLTHLHLDHSGGAAELSRAGLEVLAHPWTAEGLRRGDEDRAGLVFARTVGFYPPDARLSSCPVRDLEDGETIDLGGLTLTALATPGHSNGHHSFLAQDEDDRRTLIAGDLVFPDGQVVLQALPDCRIDLLWQSLKRARATKPDALAAGHGRVIERDATAHLDAALAAFAAGGLPRQLGS